VGCVAGIDPPAAADSSGCDYRHERAGTAAGMRQLTTLDARFLAVESARTYGHVGSLAI
jgi:hypothetical protein